MRTLLRSAVKVATMAFAIAEVVAAADAEARGGRVAWGRLVTEHSSWTVHDGNDPQLADFIRRETNLNIDSRCYPTNPANLADICSYPFVFTNNLTNIRSAPLLANLREYLRRGGFIYIDRCVNLTFSLPQEPFYARHAEFFAQLLPGSELRELPTTHEIYRCYFEIPAARRRGGEAGHNALYAVYDRGRMVALLSLANFQCGWPNNRPAAVDKMRMIANIYVYALTHEPEIAGTQSRADRRDP